jgi:hypothetical protein
MTRKARRFSLSGLCFVLLSTPALIPPSAFAVIQSPTRGQGTKPPEISQLPERGKRFALIIGIDEYADKNISRLNGARRDARALAEALIQYAGFPKEQVILLTSDEPQAQPRRGLILRYLSNLRNKVPADGLLLVAFAGHGIERRNRAFLLPWDAELSDDLDLLQDTAISVDRMRDLIRATGVKQVMLILDACRNDPSAGRGDMPNLLSAAYLRDPDFRRRISPSTGFKLPLSGVFGSESLGLRNRDIEAYATLYATGIGQRAYEYAKKGQGYFTWALVEGLSGKAAEPNGEVTLGGLKRYVEETVPPLVSLDLGAGKVQRPFAVIEGYQAEKLIVAVVPAGAAKAHSKTYELTFWDSVRDSDDPLAYDEYLKAYPDGQFVELAKVKASKLRASQPSEGLEVKPKAENLPSQPPTPSEAKEGQLPTSAEVGVIKRETSESIGSKVSESQPAVGSGATFNQGTMIQFSSVGALMTIELALWDSIKSSRNPADFREYLRRFPQGHFVGLATNRLAKHTESSITAPLGSFLPAQDSTQPKDLYLAYAQSAGDKERRGRPGAQVRVELLRDGMRRFVPVSTIFRPGDKVKFHFAVNFPAYVTVTTRGHRPHLLFPETDANQPVAPVRDYVVPSGDGLWFEFDSTPGEEQLVLILSGSAEDMVVNPPTADARHTALRKLILWALVEGRNLNLVQVSREEGYVFYSEAVPSRPVGFTIKLRHSGK